MAETNLLPKTKKVTFNCPMKIFDVIADAKINGEFGSITDAILTALREKYVR